MLVKFNQSVRLGKTDYKRGTHEVPDEIASDKFFAKLVAAGHVEDGVKLDPKAKAGMPKQTALLEKMKAVRTAHPVKPEVPRNHPEGAAQMALKAKKEAHAATLPAAPGSALDAGAAAPTPQPPTTEGPGSPATGPEPTGDPGAPAAPVSDQAETPGLTSVKGGKEKRNFNR